MNWVGPFYLRCECGWESEKKKNPVAAQFAGEAHIPHCPFYQTAMKGGIMSRSKYFSGDSGIEFLKPEDVKDGQIVIVKSFEEITNSLGMRPSLRFVGIDKPFTLNQTNYDFFMSNFGENEMSWEGCTACIKIESVKSGQNNNRMVPGIRFRMPSSKTADKKKK